MAADAEGFRNVVIWKTKNKKKQRHPHLSRPHPFPYFSSLLRYVGAGAQIDSTAVESAITMETKYITMETRDSL